MIAVTFLNPYVGIETALDASDSWIITTLDSNGVAATAGLQVNDQLVTINHQPAEQHSTVRLSRTVEQASHIEVLRDNEGLAFSLLEIQSPWLLVVMLLAAGVISSAIALGVYLKGTPKLSTYLLALVFVAIGLAFISVIASSRSDPFAQVTVTSFVIFSPFLLLHYMHQLLREKGQTFFSSRWLKLGYGLIAVFILARILCFSSELVDAYYAWGSLIILLFFMAECICLLVFLMFLSMKRQYEYSYSAAIIKTITISFCISVVPFLILSVIPDIFGQPMVDYNFSVWLILLFPLGGFCFGQRYRLFDMQKLALRQHLSYQTSMLFFRKHPAMTALNEISAELTELRTFDELKSRFLPRLCQVLSLRHAAICLIQDFQTDCLIYGNIDEIEITQAIEAGVDVTAQSYFIRLACSPDHSAYLIIENKFRKQSMNTGFGQWMNIIKSPLSLVIENIYLSQKLSLGLSELVTETANDKQADDLLWFKRSVFQLQEQERSRIASQLHDTVMQDIYFARQKLLMLEKNKDDMRELFKQLQELGEYLHIINLNAREASFLLYPHSLKEAGFAVAVSNLVEHERSRAEHQIHLQMKASEEWNNQPQEILLQWFRISQELLTNGRKHAQARFVHLLFDEQNLQYILHYVDDGVGMDKQDYIDRIGWQGIRERVASMDARITIKTKRNEGLAVTIIL